MIPTVKIFTVYIWQRIISPHMAGLAVALARRNCDVVYGAEQTMFSARAAKGWLAPALAPARLELAPCKEAVEKIAAQAPCDAVYICQGLPSNGLDSSLRQKRRGGSPPT